MCAFHRIRKCCSYFVFRTDTSKSANLCNRQMRKERDLCFPFFPIRLKSSQRTKICDLPIVGCCTLRDSPMTYDEAFWKNGSPETISAVEKIEAINDVRNRYSSNYGLHIFSNVGRSFVRVMFVRAHIAINTSLILWNGFKRRKTVFL